MFAMSEQHPARSSRKGERHEVKSLSGQKFSRLLVARRSDAAHPERRVLWECICDCGNQHQASTSALKSGRSKSCGCLMVDRTREANTTHGLTKTPEFRAWMRARARCYDTNRDNYADYGGRGIKMHERWVDDFAAFLRDMGPCPDGLTLERNDVNGDYAPGNCRWASAAEQQKNRRNSFWIEHEGRRLVLADWARELGINYQTLFHWVRYKGLSIADATTRART